MPDPVRIIPILRSFNEAQARAFYVDFLGCTVTFEHRFEPNMPLYLGLALGPCLLHVSEHHGDAAPGTALRIEMRGVADFIQFLAAKQYRYARPDPPQKQSWGTLETTITDPFFNRLIFYEDVSAG